MGVQSHPIDSSYGFGNLDLDGIFDGQKHSGHDGHPAALGPNFGLGAAGSYGAYGAPGGHHHRLGIGASLGGAITAPGLALGGGIRAGASPFGAGIQAGVGLSAGCPLCRGRYHG